MSISSLLMVAMLALPPNLRLVSHNRAEYKFQKQEIRIEGGCRLELKDGQTMVYAVPALRWDKEKWNIGPEIRYPVYGEKKETKFLLKLELKP